MAKASRSKGARGELELLKIVMDEGFTARKLSRSGYEGPDLRVEGFDIEVKRRAAGAQLSARSLEDMLAGADAIAWRYDRRSWHVGLTLPTFLKLLEGQR